MTEIRPTIPPERMYAWQSQVRQYPRSGPPGLGYFRGECPLAEGAPGWYPPVDCLLWRNRKGAVVGILNHYTGECRDGDVVLEVAGNVNVWVHPRRQHRGIGRRLVEEALRRWPDIDLAAQRYTPAGLGLATAILGRPPSKPGV